MDTILVVNAGSSSVKFQVFATGGDDGPRRLIKGQVDGIGTRPRLRAETADKKTLVDRSFAVEQIKDVPAALQAGAAWLRETQKLEPIAVGHRVVHGGPKYDQAVLIDSAVLGHLEGYEPLAPLHQPNNLTPIRAILGRDPDLPASIPRSTAITTRLSTTMPYRSGFTPRACADTASTACHTNTSRVGCPRWRRTSRARG
jgi:acetate kinase